MTRRHGTEEFRIWVVAAALYAVAIHAVAIAVFGATIAVSAPSVTAHHGPGAEVSDGTGHKPSHHVQCCVLCGVSACGEAGRSATGRFGTIVARSVRPPRFFVRRRRIASEPILARGPPLR